jgi:arylsulfatase A-like enzyme
MPLFKSAGQKELDRSIFWHFPIYYGNKAGNGVWGWTPASAVRKGDYKLLEYFHDDHLELYNLRKDISEKVDLSEVLPEKTKEMYKELKTWQKKTGAFIPQPKKS